MDEVQQSRGSETRQEDDTHQWAGHDVHRPVVVWLVQLMDDSNVAHDHDHQRHQEAEES